jgi:DNA-binding transcriptional regulator YiaG
MEPNDVLLLARARQACESDLALTIRRRARLSQAEIGATVGVSTAAVSRWETGRRVPRGKAAQRYAHLLAALAKRLGVEEWSEPTP